MIKLVIFARLERGAVFTLGIHTHTLHLYSPVDDAGPESGSRRAVSVPHTLNPLRALTDVFCAFPGPAFRHTQSGEKEAGLQETEYRRSNKNPGRSKRVRSP